MKISKDQGKKYVKEWKLFLRETKTLLSPSYGKIIAFVLLYTFAGVVFFDDIFGYLLKLGMTLADLDYIGPDTLFQLLLNIKVIPLVLLVVLLLVFLSMFEIAGVLHACSRGKIGMKTSLSAMAEAGLHTWKRTIHPKNWLIFVFLFILVPLTGVFSFSGSMLCVQIPEFIRDYIVANDVLKVIYAFLMFGLFLVEFIFIFALNIYVMEEKDFITSCKESLRLMKGNYLRVLTFLAVTALISAGLIICISSVSAEAIMSVVGLVKDFGSITSSEYATETASLIKGYLISVFNPVVNLSALTVLYFQLLEEKSMLSRGKKANFVDTKLTKGSRAFLCVFLAGISVLFVYENRNVIKEFAEPSKRPEIVAHRGDSVRAPENTMPAFELAVIENPGWIEFDIHQTKDGVLIVSHDDDLTRVAQKTLYVHELTYAETQELDVGSWFSPEFSYVRLSTLDEVLELFKETDIKIQIEVKINGYEDHLEEKLLETINKYDLHDRIIITSLQTEPLKRLLELDPTIITTYSMYIAWAGLENIEFSKYFTIEESNYNRALVDNIHAQGKLCFAWTANTEDTIQYLVDCGVDGILTDDPLLIQSALDKCDYSGGIARMLRLVLHRLTVGR